MAGELIALLRLVRLRPALVATVTSPEFIALRAFQGLSALLQCQDFWVYAFQLARAVYPLMRILRLADKKTAGMDKLYYFVLQADRVLPKYLKLAERTEDSWMTDEHKEVMDGTDDLASQHVDDVDEVEFEFSDDDEEEEPVNEAGEEVDADAEEEDSDDDDYPSGLDYEHYDSELSWPGNNLTDTVMRMWMKRRGKLVHSYALVGYMLSPNPIIMRHNQDRGKTADMQDVSSACEFVFELISGICILSFYFILIVIRHLRILLRS